MTTQTIPDEAGLVLTTFHGEQIFVRSGRRGDQPLIQLAQGEWEHEANDFDPFADVYELTPADALHLAGALVHAIKEVAPELVPTKEA